MDVECRIIFNSGREPEYKTVDIESYTDQENLVDDIADEYGDEVDDIQFVEFIDFPDVVEGMCDGTSIPDHVFEFADLSTKEQAIVEAYWCDYNQGVTDIRSILESYVCDQDDWESYATELVDDMIASVTDTRAAEMFERYFDYKKFISDLEYDYYFCGDYVFNN